MGFNFKLHMFFIKPSLQSQIKLQKKLKIIWSKYLGLSINKVIKKVNFILIKWANHFKIASLYKIFIKIDYYNWIRQYRFVKRTHPKKSLKWIKSKYWNKLYFNLNNL